MGRKCYCCGVYTDEFCTLGNLRLAVCENCYEAVGKFLLLNRLRSKPLRHNEGAEG